MNRFDLTHAFILGHFIRYYTVNYYVLLINAKHKNSAVHWKSHVLNPISLHVMTTQCNKYAKKKQHKTFKNQCCRNYIAGPKIFIFSIFLHLS